MGDKDVGFVGLGIMGKPMARNLIKAGYSLTVYDIMATSVEELATDGAGTASSAKEVAQRTPVVITMVPDSADSEAAILGPDGVLEGASQGSTVIDMSSIAPTPSVARNALRSTSMAPSSFRSGSGTQRYMPVALASFHRPRGTVNGRSRARPECPG